MALKPDREEFYYDIRYYMDEVAERGGIVSLQTAGSGGYPGDNNNVVTYAANPAGRTPVGLLLYDVVDYDPTRSHGNPYRMQVLKNSKVAITKSGWGTTNMIASGINPLGGEPGYLGPSGLITTAAGTARVGTFLTAKDQDGFAAFQVELG